jgi:large subunit ribosomal protein L15
METTSLHTLTRTTERKSMRVGRGGKRGKTAGRGTKGQSARAGNKKRPELRDIIKKLPKRRGYGKNRAYTVDGTIPDAVALTLTKLAYYFEPGTEITQKACAELGLVKGRGKRQPAVKIVGTGEITKKLTIVGISVTASAREAIEKAGGSITPSK